MIYDATKEHKIVEFILQYIPCSKEIKENLGTVLIATRLKNFLDNKDSQKEENFIDSLTKEQICMLYDLLSKKFEKLNNSK